MTPQVPVLVIQVVIEHSNRKDLLPVEVNDVGGRKGKGMVRQIFMTHGSITSF